MFNILSMKRNNRGDTCKLREYILLLFHVVTFPLISKLDLNYQSFSLRKTFYVDETHPFELIRFIGVSVTVIDDLQQP